VIPVDGGAIDVLLYQFRFKMWCENRYERVHMATHVRTSPENEHQYEDERIARSGPACRVLRTLRVVLARPESRHRLAAGALVLAKSVLGGLHHEYSLAMPTAGG